MRLIDSDILLEQFRALRDEWDTKNATHRAIRGAFVDCILRTRDAPTIMAEPVKHGTWERTDGKIHGYVCSICEYGVCTGKMPYCPNCGAKMDGDNDD